MNQYILEGIIYAMEKHGLNKVASEMMHNKRSSKKVNTKGKKIAVMYKEASPFIKALFKLAFDLSKAKRIGETALGYAKRMKGLAETTAREIGQLRHAKKPAMPSMGLNAGKKVAPKVLPKSEVGAVVKNPELQKKLRSLYTG